VRERLTILGVGAFFAVGVVGAFAIDAVTSRAEHLRIAERETRNSAEQLASQMRQLFSSADQMLRATMFLRAEWLQDPLRTPASAYRRVKALDVDSGYIRRLTWPDAEGNIQAWSESENPPAVNLARLEHFRYHAGHPNGGLHIGLPFRTLHDGAFISTISRRIETADGSFVGIVSAVVNTAYLNHVLERYHLSVEGFVSLFRRDGRHLARHPEGEAFLGQSRAEGRLFRERLPLADHATFHAASLRTGEQRIYSYHTVPGYELVVSMSVPHGVALTPWVGRIRITGVVTGLALVGALLAT
jgi:hypothetical protein